MGVVDASGPAAVAHRTQTGQAHRCRGVLAVQRPRAAKANASLANERHSDALVNRFYVLFERHTWRRERAQKNLQLGDVS